MRPLYARPATTATRSRERAARGLDNFIQVGRNGLHRYNNSDHSSLTAMRAVDNLVDGTDHDIWAVCGAPAGRCELGDRRATCDEADDPAGRTGPSHIAVEQ